MCSRDQTFESPTGGINLWTDFSWGKISISEVANICVDVNLINTVINYRLRVA